jgi:phage terminase large subunit-like protein
MEADVTQSSRQSSLMAWAVSNARVEPKGNAISLRSKPQAPQKSIR